MSVPVAAASEEHAMQNQAETLTPVTDEPGEWRVRNRLTKRWASGSFDDVTAAGRACKTLNVMAFKSGGHAKAYEVVPVAAEG
jgi:hypothetical protein